MIYRVLVLGLLLLMQHSSAYSKEPDDDRCVRTHFEKGVRYCSIPYEALLANFRKYDGINVHFYGYLNLYEARKGSDMLISASEDGGLRVDYLSCVALKMDEVVYDEAPRQGSGIYFVEVSGRYEFDADMPMCIGFIRRSKVSVSTVVRKFE